MMTTLHATLQLPNLPLLVFCQIPNPATNAVTIAINPGLAEVEREVQVRTGQGKLGEGVQSHSLLLRLFYSP